MVRRDILRRGPSGAIARTSAMTHVRSDCAIRAAAVAGLLVIAYLLAPRMGVDLSAQLERADFARHHPLAPVDLRWFGGTFPFGYSLWVPIVMGAIGAKLVGAIAAVVSTFLITRLLQVIGARRPVAGGVAGAICQVASLVEGRVAFGVGLACGLGALSAVYHHRRAAALVLALLAGAANPVVALLLWICGAVAVTQRRVVDAVVLVVASAVPVAVISGLFADGGNEPFGRSDALHALAATAVVACVIPLRYKAIRLGAVAGIVMVIAAYFVHTPVGSNATRLSLLFAIPLVVALVEFRPWLTVGTMIVAILVQVPFTFGTLRAAGSPPTTAAYYQPLLEEIHARGELTGRVEIPELIGHWDSYYVATSVPLARGWLRQVDTKLNGPALYDHAPTTSTYRTFLDANAVEYVAVPDARLSAFGRRERDLLATLPYLSRVWSSSHWTLYAVAAATPIVAAPGRLVSYSADTMTVSEPVGTASINVRWSRWLSVSDGACISDLDGRVALTTTRASTYILSSTLIGSRNRC